MRTLRAQQFVEDAGPLAHPVRPAAYREINNFYTATVYEKGAEVVRMLKTLLGPGGFRDGMDLYFKRHDGQAATVEEFIQCFADANTRDLTPVHALVFAGRHAGSGRARQLRRDRRRPIRLEVAQTTPPTPGQPVKSRWRSRSRSGSSARTGATCRCRWKAAGRSYAGCCR